MDKKALDSILKNAYNPTLWRQVLTGVFGARNLNQKPQPIMLSSNSKDIAENAFELGFFNTTDDRIIGLYQINLTDKPQIWRNKVGLRNLLRNIYQTDVDGALVVFVQNDKWRLSFISEIRVLNDDGTIDTKATEPKRYTYLLGKGEKTKTPTDRLSLLANKKIALEDIRAAFSVEALNSDFYNQISDYFSDLVGATTKKGKKIEFHQRLMSLPGATEDTKENKKLYKEFGVRLIGRTIFCWFLKVKKSANEKPLLPDSLLSLKAAEKHNNYYHNILEPLFFQTLNTPMDKRIKDLPEGCDIVPFLNGGLFEPQNEDFYNTKSKTGNFQNYALKIPDDWFQKLFKTLEDYNFTIDENSPTEVEISVDPEMLGRIFENLLAAIDEDSGEVARKATGSFYTPREIVNYMVDESLLIYLKSKLLENSIGFTALTETQSTFWGNETRGGQLKIEEPLNENRWKDKTDELEKTLRRLFSYSDNENPFDEADTRRLIKAIDECKILDPACGSGAFPIGVLQRLVYLLGKLDRKSQKWKQAQLDKIDSLIANAGEIDDRNIRGKVIGDLENRKREIERDFANKELDFSRKLFLIENCIYGVDIQPIAAEISKLRCFLTLIVDDTIDERAPNRGVNPLPNLEFKFVTADALLRLPASGLFNSDAQLKELAAVRHEYINSFGAGKEAAKLHFKRIQDEIADAQVKNFRENYDRRAFELSRWNPFGHERVDWFDSEWMFGVKAFDIVIGNPPYIKEYTNKSAFDGIRGKEFYQGKMDIWYYFAAHFLKYFTKPKTGLLTFIATNNWVTNSGASKLRNKIAEDVTILRLTDFGNTKIFASADIQTMILIAENQNSISKYKFDYAKITSDQAKLSDAIELVSGLDSDSYFRSTPTFNRKEFVDSIFTFSGSSIDLILEKIKKASNFTLDSKKEVAQGTVAPQDFINRASLEILGNGFKLGQGIFNLTNAELKSLNLSSNEKELIKPFYTTEELGRYFGNPKNQIWLIYTDSSFKYSSAIKPYPNLKKHLDQFRDVITSDNAPYGLHRARNEYFFVGEKIISLRKCARPTFTYTDFDCYVSQTYFVIKTNRVNQKFLTALLNSNLIAFWLKHRGKMQGFQYQVDKEPLLNLPLIRMAKTKTFENLVDYILFLKETDKAEQVNEYVPNSHLVEQFEEVIDALVYELYFEADFQRAEIHFHKYASRNFPAIENLTHPEKIKTIHAAYQTLRQKDNEIRNNLKLMDIRLADLIMPIKTAR